MSKNPVATGVKFVASLLVIGGFIGVALGVWGELANFNSGGMLFLIPITLLFAWSVWVGVNLWYGKASAYRWAKVLFALQIPIVSIPSFTYHFYEAFMVSMVFSRGSETKFNFGLQLASAFTVRVLSEPQTVVLGVNLVAIGAVLYLINQSPQNEHLVAATRN